MSEETNGVAASFWSVIPWPVLHSQALSDKTKLIYGVIASLTQARDDDGKVRGYCFASNAYLASVMGCGERTITRSIAELVDAGELIVQHVGVCDKKGNRMRRIYTLETYARGIVKTGETANFGDTGIVKTGETVINRFDNRSHDIPPISPPQGDGAEKKIEAEREMLFNRFWACYPRKVGKQEARKAWDKLKPDLILCSQMSRALKAQMQSEQWTRDGGRYIPHPSTWLNGRRWEDETPEASDRPENNGVLGRRFVRTDIVDGEEIDIYE
jgi:hypothetical protein